MKKQKFLISCKINFFKPFDLFYTKKSQFHKKKNAFSWFEMQITKYQIVLMIE